MAGSQVRTWSGNGVDIVVRIGAHGDEDLVATLTEVMICGSRPWVGGRGRTDAHVVVGSAHVPVRPVGEHQGGFMRWKPALVSKLVV